MHVWILVRPICPACVSEFHEARSYTDLSHHISTIKNLKIWIICLIFLFYPILYFILVLNVIVAKLACVFLFEIRRESSQLLLTHKSDRYHYDLFLNHYLYNC